MDPIDCPCGRGRPLSECCGPYLAGEPPPTAEALMRSRYTAFATGAVDYLLDTHDPATRAARDRAAIARTAAGTRWRGLTILETEAGGPEDTEGRVRFEARYTIRGRPGVLHEDAAFRRIEGRWFYVAGTPDRPAPAHRATPKVGRNDPCPCGSGRKFKRCCGP